MRVRPHIMLEGGVAADAVALWAQAFPGLSAAESGDGPAPLWRITLGDQEFTLFDSPLSHDFAPTPSWSFMVDLDTADEVDTKLAILAEGGTILMPPDRYDFAERFAWVADRFGMSWQLRYGPTP